MCSAYVLAEILTPSIAWSYKIRYYTLHTVYVVYLVAALIWRFG